MKAFLLAAGHGTRLRPLTNNAPKCLLPVQGIPMLQIWLETCARYGIREVLINIHAHAAMVRDYLQRRTPEDVTVHVAEEQELLGSAGTLIRNREWVRSEPYFWIFYADVLHRVDLAAMLALHQLRRPAATIGAYRVPDPSRCGILELDEDRRVVDFVEKPCNPRSNLAFSGLLIGTAQLLDAVPPQHPVDLGFHVLPRLVGNMFAYVSDDFLIDIGTMKNYQSAQRTWPGLSPSLTSTVSSQVPADIRNG